MDLELVKGNSLTTIPNYETSVLYDIIIIDGGHGFDCACKDIINCKKFSKNDTIVVIDDAFHGDVRKAITKNIDDKIIKEIDYNKNSITITKYHRMFNYIL